MSLLTSLYNKVQYLASKNLSDPNAEVYAKQQAEQIKQDKETRRREAVAASKEADKLANDESDAAAAKALALRSKFDHKSLISDIATHALTGIIIAVVIILMGIGGYLAANQAIGYNNPFRILSFIYGCLAFFYVIPRSLYLIYGKGETLPSYALLPLYVYVPSSDINVKKTCNYIFCYQEDEASVKARSLIENLYSKVHAESLLPTPQIPT